MNQCDAQAALLQSGTLLSQISQRLATKRAASMTQEDYEQGSHLRQRIERVPSLGANFLQGISE
jgi:hypothetical protein